MSNKVKSNGYREEVTPLVAFDLVDLLHQEFEPLQWIIPDYLPEGLTLLFSRPKVGKSMLALALALRMARRVSGGIDGTTLYLALDDTNQRRLQSRTRSLLQGEEIERGRVWAATQAHSLDDGLIEQLTLWMQAHTDTRLIVIDVYARVKPKKHDDDVYKSDYEALVKLQEFAVLHHIAILLVHHTRKQKDTEDWIDNCNGSTGLTAAVDTLWTLERKPHSNELTLRVKGRDTMGELTVQLTLDDIDAPWVVPTEDTENGGDIDLSVTQQQILTALGQETRTPKEIAALTAINHITVRTRLRRMLTKGLVEQSTYGSYRVPELDQRNVWNSGTLAPNPTPDTTVEQPAESCQSESHRVPRILDKEVEARELSSERAFLAKCPAKGVTLELHPDGYIAIEAPDEQLQSSVAQWVAKHEAAVITVLTEDYQQSSRETYREEIAEVQAAIQAQIEKGQALVQRAPIFGNPTPAHHCFVCKATRWVWVNERWMCGTCQGSIKSDQRKEVKPC